MSDQHPGQPPTPDLRRRFLDERRKSSQRRYDAIHAASYDERWGDISPSHARWVHRLLDAAQPGGTVLDAACGTGKYWALVLERGFSIVGTDQSAGMLRVAAAKHPGIPTSVVALQDLDFDATFDAAMCVDAMENVGPEDWPAVIDRLGRAARPGAPIYLTVELPNRAELTSEYWAAVAAGHPVVPGEAFDGTGYHYYPEPATVTTWLGDAGLAILGEEDADHYHHLLLTRTG